MKKLLLIILCFWAVQAYGQTKTENIILVTLDGMRWQEIFSGASPQFLKDKSLLEDTSKFSRLFNANTPEERRKKLLPFFWSTVATQGQLLGNRQWDCKVNTMNKMWFSYPGYNEILTGFADDIHINSNDGVDNPNKNVLEYLQSLPAFRGQVAAFTSWETFPWIINTQRSGVPVNAGWTAVTTNPSTREQLLNSLSEQLPRVSGDTRLDAITFHYAFEYLKKANPRILFISFDETDHFAHGGKYDDYLTSAHYTDALLAELWSYVQSTPKYKDKTTLIITTDHGRGTTQEGWKHHGSKVEEADQIWMAFLGPDTRPLGEVKKPLQFYQGQTAATLAAFLGLKYTNESGKVAPVIQQVIGK
ncbi:MAG TPA: alkaline phosphatase family protein [Cyclobacteriaceae bacterium]|nr:alkaline phosphatase family protein [Cyclobacteriaceae bacterium]